MKYRYASLLAVSLVIAIFILLFSITSGIDPMTLARSQNGEIMQYLTEARKSLVSAKSNASSASLSGLVKSVDEHLAAAQVVTNDQKKNLD
jgi:hypothetical protein